ncbi:MAG: PilZ domain-containing protein [Pseudomonadota bacterium]|nr:PilZ domain-containing protein [Pseudomonadota bacterium]
MQEFQPAHALQHPRTLESELQESDNTLTYDSPLAIARVLDEACAKRAPLTLKLETASRIHLYHSRIQSIDSAAAQMVLHQLMPSNWTELVTHEFVADVSCVLPSGVLRFISTLAPLEAATTNPYCVLALPQVMYKQQSRSSYRVVMPPGSSRLSLIWRDRLVHGFCFNLSLEGCCGIFRGELDMVSRGVVVPGLSVSLDDSLQFTIAATVCRRQAMHNGSTLLGLRFDPLESELQRRLQASLTGIQRRLLRTRA